MDSINQFCVTDRKRQRKEKENTPMTMHGVKCTISPAAHAYHAILILLVSNTFSSQMHAKLTTSPVANFSRSL